MLFLVVGTPWKRPRSSRLRFPDRRVGWFGGRSSTRTATLRMRLRNSFGSESSASSTTLTKCSRFILHRPRRALASSPTQPDQVPRRFPFDLAPLPARLARHPRHASFRSRHFFDFFPQPAICRIILHTLVPVQVGFE